MIRGDKSLDRTPSNLCECCTTRRNGKQDGKQDGKRYGKQDGKQDGKGLRAGAVTVIDNLPGSPGP
ncbi:hypothetical protein [Streptomyces sp. Da 82-17]|uniref:hypothetical protein n=1 Tax=Streptomyces sp. Da 82-17 TaxID=3377116 RepID=UPI0038D3E174